MSYNNVRRRSPYLPVKNVSTENKPKSNENSQQMERKNEQRIFKNALPIKSEKNDEETKNVLQTSIKKRIDEIERAANASPTNTSGDTIKHISNLTQDKAIADITSRSRANATPVESIEQAMDKGCNNLKETTNPKAHSKLSKTVEHR